MAKDDEARRRAQARTPADLTNEDAAPTRGVAGERGEDASARVTSARGYERPDGEDWKMEYVPDAQKEGDRAALSESEAFEDVHPYATAETFEAQTSRNPATFPGSALRETAEGEHGEEMPKPGERNVATRRDRAASPRENPD